MTSPIPLVVAHSMPGRTRLRLAGSGTDIIALAVAATRLRKAKGVRSVEPRPVTGSLVVLHEGEFAAVAGCMPGLGLALSASAEARRPAAPRIGRIEPGTAGAIGLAALALVQMRRGNLLPPALTLAWYAGSVLGYLPKGPPVDAADH